MPSSPARSVHRRPVVVLWTWPFSSALRAVRGSVTAPSECRKPALTPAEAAVLSGAAASGRSPADPVREHRRAEDPPCQLTDGGNVEISRRDLVHARWEAVGGASQIDPKPSSNHADKLVARVVTRSFPR